MSDFPKEMHRSRAAPGCECDGCVESRRRSRWARKMQLTGRSLMVQPAEAERGRLRLAQWREAGASADEIAAVVGCAPSTVYAQWAGRSDTMLRTTYDAVMGSGPVVGVTGHTLVPVAGTQRRIQALARAGFSYEWVAAQMGTTAAHPHRIAIGRRAIKTVAFRTAMTVRDVYEKYRDQDDLARSFGPVAYARAQAAAQRRGFAPWHVWDDDTMDDPQTFPEWTGGCGTVKGYYLHYRHKIAMCEPCRQAAKEAEIHVNKVH